MIPPFGGTTPPSSGQTPVEQEPLVTCDTPTNRPPALVPKRRLTDRLPHLPHLSPAMLAKFVGAMTTLAVACAAYIKPETSSRKTYDVLAHNLEEQSKANAQNHLDIVALRNYLEGYTQHSSQEPVDYQVSPADAGSPASSTSLVASKPPAHSAVVKMKRVVPPPAPPPVSPPPATYEARSYKSVTGTDDIK